MNEILSKKYSLIEDVVARTNQDGTVIIMKMDESNTFYKINGIAADCWHAIGKNEVISDFIQNIVTEYDVQKEKIESDVTELLNKLLSKNLIA